MSLQEASHGQLRHETIVPLIGISRKLEACDEFQLSEWLSKSVQIFSKGNSLDLLKKMLITSFCLYRGDISSPIFQNILSSSPIEKQLINLDDSISKSDIDPNDEDKKENDEKEPLTFLSIPKDLKIVAFNFLKEKELFQVQKVCRCLNIAARDPNSLHYLELDYKSKLKHYYHPWYSRTKSLKVDIYEKVLNNYITGSTIKILELRSVIFDNECIRAIIKCINLENLYLFLFQDSVNVESIINDHNLQKTLNDPNTNQFANLHDLQTNFTIFKIPSFFHWILCNAACKKDLYVTDYAYATVDCEMVFCKNSKMALLALQTINEFYLDIEDWQGMNGYVATFLHNLLALMSNPDLKFNFNHFRFKYDKIEDIDVNIEAISASMKLVRYADISECLINITQEVVGEEAELDWISKLKGIYSTFDVVEIRVTYACLMRDVFALLKKDLDLNSDAMGEELVSDALRAFDLWHEKLSIFRDTKAKNIYVFFDLRCTKNFREMVVNKDDIFDDFLDDDDEERKLTLTVAERKWSEIIYPVIARLIKEWKPMLFEIVEESDDELHIQYTNYDDTDV